MGYAAAVAVVLIWRGFRRPAAWMLVVMVATTATTTLVKGLVDRPRPPYEPMVLHDGSFPSGHASNAAAAAGVAIVLATLFLRRRNQRRLVTVVAVGLAVLSGSTG